MDSEMREQFEKKFGHLIAELEAMRQTYKAEIEYNPEVYLDIDIGIRTLEDAFSRFNRLETEPEEHASSSAANYRDYMAEERATTDRDS